LTEGKVLLYRIAVDALSKAIELAGGQAALAEQLGISRAAVNQWVKGLAGERGGRPVPAGRCIAIEKIVAARVTRYDLRPDIFGEAQRAA
jgi:DNA-binding transcriptional regulator YdaS (Cro superfamily)